MIYAKRSNPRRSLPRHRQLDRGRDSKSTVIRRKSLWVSHGDFRRPSALSLNRLSRWRAFFISLQRSGDIIRWMNWYSMIDISIAWRADIR
ncbi:hypothetical protein [Novipirellula galeiformis]|uniref:hypothetical protein n=1 Tax=Novipirellula galeiformis TaxID=2528004 RepID=UPI0011B5FD33|nr:hypothetical protein [Novipirellula galeiformis]